MRIIEKSEENKFTESANLSVLSDISQGSRKNFIPKELIFGEANTEKTLNKEIASPILMGDNNIFVNMKEGPTTVSEKISKGSKLSSKREEFINPYS
jgi:hypothetical protein